ncbi:MAG TPA: zinc ribbon domain-containing protein, partial [Gemmatimonadales bacterium]|nr:zinc ribbon domain-containing protein [Gemmatimonadales bacterium]
FARTEPADVRAEFEVEVGSSNPDLEIVHRHGNAVVSLEPKQLALALNHQPGLAFAPPEAPGGPPPREEAYAALPDLPSLEPPEDVQVAGATGQARLQCGLCERALPTGRVANFCPHCGASQGVSRCPACRSEVETGWRHCIGCGSALSRR